MMPRCYIAADFDPFPDVPANVLMNLAGDMFLSINLEVSHASNAEDYRRSVEWVRTQRMGR